MTKNAQPWYAVRVKVRQEQSTQEGLSARGIESIFPSHKVRRRWSDRQVERVTPLFPGYLFATFDFHDRSSLVQTPGVMEVVAFGGRPAPIDPAEIDALRALVESALPAKKHPYPAGGTRVEVVTGPLVGHEGYWVERKSEHHLILTVSLIFRAVSVEISEADVEPTRPDGTSERGGKNFGT